MYAEQIAYFLGEDEIDPPLQVGPPLTAGPMEFHSWSEISQICGDSRAWGGMHFAVSQVYDSKFAMFSSVVSFIHTLVHQRVIITVEPPVTNRIFFAFLHLNTQEAIPAGAELCGGGEMAESISASIGALIDGDESAAIFKKDVGELMVRSLH